MIRYIVITACLCLFTCITNAAPLQNKKTVLTQTDSLPERSKSHKNYSKVIGWKNGAMPTAPKGFTVTQFAKDLKCPRWIYQAPNGDIFVAESATILKGIIKFGAKISRKIKTENIGESPNRIRMFRDADKNGSYETMYMFAENLNQPFGMLILNNKFYVACTEALYSFNYTAGDTMLNGGPVRLVNLPADGYNNHWTRNVIANAAGTKLYITVGSGTNVAEHGLDNEIRRANILEVDIDGSGEKIYASGLRNPVGLSWNPVTKTLWTVVNERDGLGDDLVPDYATGVKEGAFYGWPWSYYGQHPDPRMKKDPRPDMVAKAMVPDISLGAHTASLGLTFYTKNNFPQRYRNGMFIGQHGSWNRSSLVGYKVVFIPFANGQPSGKPEDFLTGFIANIDKDEVHGRPVGVTVLQDGSLLVADDASNCIWKVTAN